MDDFKGPLHDEFSQLDIRIEELEQFILSSKFNELPDIDRKDLKEQLLHMQRYFAVLARRTSRLCNSV